jgi:AraC family transcriptional regulator
LQNFFRLAHMPTTAASFVNSPQPQGWADYEQRLNRVTAYIYEHLREPLDLTALAEVAHLSPHHWHRVYHAMRGETIAATVKRARLHHAAGLLAQSSLSVAAVAQRAGYPSAASFSRIFKASFGQPPAQYRAGGSHAQFAPRAAANDNRHAAPGHNVTVRECAAVVLAALPHQGSYMHIGKTFTRLFDLLGTRGQMQPGMRCIGVYHKDPAMVSASALRAHAGMSVANANAVQAPLQSLTLTAGPYAVLRYQGPYATMHAAYRWLFGQWLPQSGFAPADAPVYEDYLNNPRDTAPTELLTDIYLPLR